MSPLSSTEHAGESVKKMVDLFRQFGKPQYVSPLLALLLVPVVILVIWVVTSLFSFWGLLVFSCKALWWLGVAVMCVLFTTDALLPARTLLIILPVTWAATRPVKAWAGRKVYESPDYPENGWTGGFFDSLSKL